MFSLLDQKDETKTQLKFHSILMNSLYYIYVSAESFTKRKMDDMTFFSRHDFHPTQRRNPTEWRWKASINCEPHNAVHIFQLNFFHPEIISVFPPPEFYNNNTYISITSYAYCFIFLESDKSCTLLQKSEKSSNAVDVNMYFHFSIRVTFGKY